MPLGISDSRFYMWRGIVAMIHADGVVTPHELSFLNDHIQNIELSPAQMDIIKRDLQHPQDVYDMFAHLDNNKDKRDFFMLARALSWCDGDFDAQEKHIIETLEASHIDESTQAILQDSREIMHEVELCENQWKFKSERAESLLGFLNKRRAA